MKFYQLEPEARRKLLQDEGIALGQIDDTVLRRLDELSELESIAFDEVYFVLSPQWVPYEFCHLFDLIINYTFSFISL